MWTESSSRVLYIMLIKDGLLHTCSCRSLWWLMVQQGHCLSEVWLSSRSVACMGEKGSSGASNWEQSERRQWITGEMLEKQSKVGNTWCLDVDESKWNMKSVPVVSLVQLTAHHVRPGLDPPTPLRTHNPPSKFLVSIIRFWVKDG